MFELLSKVQALLDDVMLKHGITSHHNRKTSVDMVATSDKLIQAYIVYKIPSSYIKTYGDGKTLLQHYTLDINLYYDSKTVKTIDCDKYLNEIKEKMISVGFKIKRGESELYDLDNPYQGVNLEFSCVEVSKK